MSYQQLTSEILKVSKFWDESAKLACVNAVRSDTPEDKLEAKLMLARCHACETMKNMLISFIHDNWTTIKQDD